MRIHQESISSSSVNAAQAAATSKIHTPESQASTGRPQSLDGFVHTEVSESMYTDYSAQGTYAQDDGRILPDRYYNGTICGNVFYKGGTASYIELLEEAVETGQYTLDETQSAWNNVHAAQKILIDDKAKPLFPWSSKLYSEDGQYVFRVENGQITGSTATFYMRDGKKISILDMAEQLASGVSPADIEDVGLLLRLDPELHAAATEIGNAKRVFEQQTQWYENGEVSKEDYLSELHPILLLLLGRDTGEKGIEQLRKIFDDPDYGKKALANYRLPVSDWEDFGALNTDTD